MLDKYISDYERRAKRKEILTKGLEIGLGAVILSAVTFMGHVAGVAITFSLQNVSSKVEIEKNVAETSKSSKFTCSAFTALQENGEKSVDIFGTRIKSVGDVPTFTSVAYKIDSALYDKILKYIDISYEYGKSGQVINAEYTVREPEIGFTPKRAEWNILKALMEVTKQEPINVTELGNTSVGIENAYSKYLNSIQMQNKDERIM